MEEKLLEGDATDNLESLHNVRLTALLHDLMKEGKLEAAQLLGVNHKTLTAALDSGVLTPRLSDALEKVLLSREMEAFGTVRERVDELVGRVESVEEQGKNIPGEIEEAVKGEVERRMVEWIRAMEGAASQEANESTDAVDEEDSPPRKLFRTTSSSVVTINPQPGDEEVFGEAWPLVDEWRRLRESHPFNGKGLAWLEDEERLRELEIELIGERGLTVPPDTDPWDSLSRRTQVRWRTQTLERVHRERVLAQIRQWIRRILTLGRWRN
ncbi:MAG: hypothetical protein F4Z29_13065 [Gemmatimonadetes bacterium]|nr:hypothetical protein [Gemmatimonadota bacterium]